MNQASTHLFSYRLLAFVGATSLIAALAVIRATPAADGYEISIYDAYPPYLWFLIGVSLAVGIWILVRQAFSEERSNWWVVGLALILLTSSIVLLLPLFRGYAAYGRFDQMYHLGLIRDIQLTGHFGAAGTTAENFYPITHILAATMSHVTGLDTKVLLMAAPTLLFLFYVVCIYLLSRELTLSHGQSLLVTAFGSLPLFSWHQSFFIPSLSTFFLLPFLLFLYYRGRQTTSRRLEYGLLFVLMLFLMPFSHSANGGLFLVLVLSCLHIGHSAYQWRRWKPMESSNAHRSTLGLSFLNSIAIVLAVWFLWFSAFRVFESTVQEASDLVVYGQSPLHQHLSSLGRAQASVYDVMKTFLVSYGPLLMYSMVAAVTGLVVWARLFFSGERTHPSQIGFPLILISFAIWALLASLGLISGGTTTAQQRYLPYVLFSATLMNGVGIGTFLKRPCLERLAVPIVSVALIASGVIGIFNLHLSPFMNNANQQVTTMDLEGTEWFFNHQSDAFLIDQIAFVQRTYQAAVLGAQVWPSNVRSISGEREKPPEHFGYDRNQTYGTAYAEDRYFVNDRLSRIWYPQGLGRQYEALWKWTPADFDGLEGDPTVSRLYNNGEFEVFYVEAGTEEVRDGE